MGEGDKRATTIVRALLDAIASYGKPKAIRTDNEAVFRSHAFNAALKRLSIRHQTIEPHCPGKTVASNASSACSRASWTVGR